MNQNPKQPRSTLQIFQIPLLLALLSLAGLIAALVGDGLFDVISWITLAIPCITIAWFVWKPKARIN